MSWYETRKRSVTKAVTWRVIATLTTMGIVYGLTGDLVLAGGAGAIEVVAKFVLYYLHDRAWNKLSWGVRDD